MSLSNSRETDLRFLCFLRRGVSFAPKSSFDRRMEPMKHEKHSIEHINRTEVKEKLVPLIENTAMRFNLIPLEIDFSREDGKWFLRIFLYSNDHYVTLEDCENVSRSLSDFLDELIPVKFYLEVSSPGLDRKLKSEREFIIFCGKVLDVKLKKSVDETHNKHFKARLEEYDVNKGINLIRCEDNASLWVKMDDIHSARLSYEDNIEEENKMNKNMEIGENND